MRVWAESDDATYPPNWTNKMPPRVSVPDEECLRFVFSNHTNKSIDRSEVESVVHKQFVTNVLASDLDFVTSLQVYHTLVYHD
jgi:hypothetical protein